MRTLFTAAFFAAATVGFSIADEPKKDDDKKTEKAPETVKEKLAAMQKSIRSDLQAWQKEYAKAEKADRATLMNKRMEIIHGYGKKAFELARDFPKDESVFDCLIMALQAGSDKTKTEIGNLILKDFVDDPKLIKLLPQLAEGEDGAKLVAKIANNSKNKDIRGVAKYSMIESEIEAADTSEKKTSLKDSTAKFDAIAAKLEAILTEYGGVKLEDGKTIAAAAKKQKFFLEHLVVGKPVPDVESELLDGKKAKLSDYKGKVVVLDIWATWCGPCKAMIPHERELVEKLKGKKFTFISVSADEKKADLEKFLEKEEMPWTHMWDGRSGKLTETFQVRYFPTIYVIDAKGVIRYKHVRGKDMDEAVETLLKEVDGAQ